MATPPESTKTSLRQHLQARAQQRWPQLTTVQVRHHSTFAYITGELADGTTLPLMRLRYNGSATTWGFAIYRASHQDYKNSILPNGYPFGTPQETLDCACGLYLNDTTAWQQPPTNKQARPLAEELHFGHTAERLHLTQSRVSQAIRAMEGHVGGRLFDRTTRRVRLTPVGEDLRDRLVPAYAELLRAFDVARELVAGVVGELRISAPSLTALGPSFGQIHATFGEHHPDCR